MPPERRRTQHVPEARRSRIRPTERGRQTVRAALVAVPLVFAVIAFCLRFFEVTREEADLSSDWPATAAQVLATLLLALALEAQFVGTVGLQRPILFVGAAVILAWVAIAMYRACFVAANGAPFSHVDDAIVAGGLTAVTWVVVMAAFVGALDEEWRK